MGQKPVWGYQCPESVAIAVTKNAVVIADTKKVAAVQLDDGKLMWGHSLPAAPVPWGLAVDQNGQVLVTLTDGQIICIGE